MRSNESIFMELSEEAGKRIARRLLLHAADQGFFSYALLSRTEWEAVLHAQGLAQEEGSSASPEQRSSPGTNDAAIDVLRNRYGLDSAGAMLVVALRYASDVKPDFEDMGSMEGSVPEPVRLPAPIPGKPVARVGRFARGNWYREILSRLSNCAAQTLNDMVDEGLPRMPARLWHRFANSRFPEKALAVAAGLGTIGRNGVLIARRSNHAEVETAREPPMPRWSSAVVLGFMLLPFDLPHAACVPRQHALAPLELCATCARCVEACPSNALVVAAVPSFARKKCIQHYSSIDGSLPELILDAWSDQLYGCDICLEACPHFVTDSCAQVRTGKIGGAFDAASVAEMDDEALRRALKGSALDQKWISIAALKRNASIAALRAT